MVKCTILSGGNPNQEEDMSIPVFILAKHITATAMIYSTSRVLDIILPRVMSEYEFSEEFGSVEVRSRDIDRIPT